MQIKTELAMSPEAAQEYVALSREVWDAAKTMSRDERHSMLDEVYAVTPMYTFESIKESGGYDIINGEAHIPVVGMLVNRASPCAALFGEASTEYGFITTAIERAENDPAVNEIVLRINTPGGEVGGLDRAGMAVAMAEKPTRAVVDHIAASGGYWIASQADRITLTSPTNMVGSIGVVMEAIDTTDRDKERGIKRVVLTSTDAPDKRIDPTTDAGAKKIVARLDDLHAVFVQRVADGRGVSPDTVSKSFGRGGMVIAKKALEVGMVDEVIDVQRLESEIAKDNTGVAGDTTAAKAETHKEGVMDLNTLKNEHPAVFAEAVQAGRTEGVEAERARVAELRSYIEADPENSRVREVVEAAIAEGKSVTDINAKLQVAIRDGSKLDGENPPEVATAKDSGADLTEEDRQAAQMMGMSIEEYIKYSGGNQ